MYSYVNIRLNQCLLKDRELVCSGGKKYNTVIYNAYLIFLGSQSLLNTHHTSIAIPLSHFASYLLPFGKNKVPLPWNMPSFISPSYFVSVGNVYFPVPSRLENKKYLRQYKKGCIFIFIR